VSPTASSTPRTALAGAAFGSTGRRWRSSGLRTVPRSRARVAATT